MAHDDGKPDGQPGAAEPTRAIDDLSEVEIREPAPSADATRAIDDLSEVEIREPSPARVEAQPVRPEEWIGRVLDARYRLTDVLGEGGFGFVFRAKHLILGRDVAVKILQSADGADPLARARFERESSMLAALSHPHIVSVTDFGVSEGLPYLVMELVDGQSLRALMDRGAIEPERAIHIVLHVLKALAYAHEHGIVHRDLKPANVLVQTLGGEDHAKLLDFGFAKFFGELETKAGNVLTAHGTTFGTTGYVAPEQLGSAAIDGRTDLYAASVMIFEMIAGRRPFQVPGADKVHELRATLLEAPPSLGALRPDLPLAAALDPLLARGLAKEPAARFESALEMARAIEALVPRASAVSPVGASASGPSASGPSASGPSASEAAPIGATAVAAPPVELAAATSAAPPITTAAAAPAAPTIATATPAPAARRGPNLAVIAAMLAVPALMIGAVAMVAIAWAFTRDRSEPVAPPIAMPAPPLPEPEVELGPLLLGPPVGDRPPPGDPWSDPIPPELAEIRARVEAGEALRGPERRLLGRMTREQPWDPRPHLLIGYAERQERSLTVAIQSYERAYRASPASRGDAHMLTDLVVMASHPTAGERAADAIETIYGSEAIPALDRAIAVSIVDPRTHTRLRALRDRLAATTP